LNFKLFFRISLSVINFFSFNFLTVDFWVLDLNDFFLVRKMMAGLMKIDRWMLTIWWREFLMIWLSKLYWIEIEADYLELLSKKCSTEFVKWLQNWIVDCSNPPKKLKPVLFKYFFCVSILQEFLEKTLFFRQTQNNQFEKRFRWNPYFYFHKQIDWL
jgi:hypothetical protein